MDKQVYRQRFSLKTVGLFLLSGTRASCYTYALLFFFLGFLLSNTSRFLLIKSLNVGVGTIVSAHFCIAAESSKRRTLGKIRSYRPTSDSTTVNVFKRNISHSSRNINTKGGSYNEHIAGDYFEQKIIIQGYEVDVSKGISEIAEQLRQIEARLQKQGENSEEIQLRIIDDLREQAHTNSKLEAELLAWVSELKGSSYQADTDVAVKVFAKQTFSYSKDQLNNSIEVPSGRYQKLHELLQNKQWTEADVETARLIFELCNKDFDARHSYKILRELYRDKLIPRDVEELHIEDLKRINALWFNASNGRFGFSVQRQLWERSHEDINNKLESFGNAVGWRGVGGWIYYSDLSNLFLSDRRGFFPAIVTMSRSTDRPTSCEPNISLFRVFMKRAYTL